MGKALTRLNKRKKVSPELVDKAKQADNAYSLEILAESEGGKIVINTQLMNFINATDTLMVKFQSLTLQEFVGLSATMKASMDIVLSLKKAKSNKALLFKELEELLAAEPEPPEEE